MKIVNIIAIDDLEKNINLDELSKREGVEFDSEMYHAAYVKVKGMKGKATIFSNGKIILVGNTSIKNVKNDLKIVKEFIFSI